MAQHTLEGDLFPFLKGKVNCDSRDRIFSKFIQFQKSMKIKLYMNKRLAIYDLPKKKCRTWSADHKLLERATSWGWLNFFFFGEGVDSINSLINEQANSDLLMLMHEQRVNT